MTKEIEILLVEIKEYAKRISLHDFRIDSFYSEDLEIIFINHNLCNIKQYPDFEKFMAQKMKEYFYSKHNYDVSIGYDFEYAEKCKKQTYQNDLSKMLDLLKDKKDEVVVYKMNFGNSDVKTVFSKYVETNSMDIKSINFKEKSQKDNHIKIQLPKKSDEIDKELFDFHSKNLISNFEFKSFKNINKQEAA